MGAESSIDERAEKIAEDLVGTRIFQLSRRLGLDALCRYLRVDASGFERIPATGPAVVIANHSGCAGLDAIILAHLIHKHTGREPRIMVHRGYFRWLGPLRALVYKLRLREPSLTNAALTLEHGHILIVFPEGEAGNFKSTWSRYHLQPFHTGFLRLALKTGAPIIPAIIVGAEETHLNIGNINLSTWLPHVRIPLPLNLIPLPARWSIRLQLPASVKPDEELSIRASDLRKTMQHLLDREIERRRYIYFPGL